MTLFLIRHAHAVSADENPARPLSLRGQSQVRHLAAFFKRTGVLKCGEFWHSPLARSFETADQLLRNLGHRGRLVEVPGLESDDPPEQIAARLRSRRTPLAIVGHEPHLTALATLLLTDKIQPPKFALRKSGALALDRRRSGGWAVRWHIVPELCRLIAR